MEKCENNHDKYFNLTARETDNWIHPFGRKSNGENKIKTDSFHEEILLAGGQKRHIFIYFVF